MRPHPRLAETDPNSPRGWATCDRCGFVTNLYKLQWQFEWRGTQKQNIRILVCEYCVDEPQRQLGTVILPPDPLGLLNARPEQYDIDEIPISTRYTMSGNIRTVVRTTLDHRPPPYYNQRIITFKGMPTPTLPLPVIPPEVITPAVFDFSKPAQSQYLIIIGTGI